MKLLLVKLLMMLGVLKPFVGFSAIIEQNAYESKESSVQGCDKPDGCSGCQRC